MNRRMSAWEGKCCLVTGGTKGIGKATVEAFAAKKARVFTCARTTKDVDRALEAWHKQGYDVQACVCDVSKKQDLETLVEKVATCFDGKLHALVSNAGMFRKNTINGCTDQEYEAIMSTNLRPSFDLCRMCHPLLKRAAPSSVVLIGSFVQGRAVAACAVHSMTKASLRQLAMNLACEWAPDQIRVNSVAPGPIDISKTAAEGRNEDVVAAAVKETPMKRMGEPEEIASVVLFFSGPGASFITGQNLYVDGGISVRGLGF